MKRLAHDMRYMIAIVLVAGCAIGGERIYNLITHRADPSGYLYADAQFSSNIATHISGNPFGVAPETLANIVGAGDAFRHFDVRVERRQLVLPPAENQCRTGNTPKILAPIDPRLNRLLLPEESVATDASAIA